MDECPALLRPRGSGLILLFPAVPLLPINSCQELLLGDELLGYSRLREPQNRWKFVIPAAAAGKTGRKKGRKSSRKTGSVPSLASPGCGSTGKEGLQLFPCLWNLLFPPPEDKWDFAPNASKENILGMQIPSCRGGLERPKKSVGVVLRFQGS